MPALRGLVWEKYLSLIFSVLFLISGIVFFCLYAMNYISDFVPLSMGGSLLEFLPMSNPCFLQRMKTPFLCLKALFGRKRKTAGIFLFIPRILKRYFAFRVKVSAFPFGCRTVIIILTLMSRNSLIAALAI